MQFNRHHLYHLYAYHVYARKKHAAAAALARIAHMQRLEYAYIMKWNMAELEDGRVGGVEERAPFKRHANRASLDSIAAFRQNSEKVRERQASREPYPFERGSSVKRPGGAAGKNLAYLI